MIGVLHMTCLDILITQRRVLPYPVRTERNNQRKIERGVNTDRETRWSTRLSFLASNANGISVETWRQTQILIARKQGPARSPPLLASVCRVLATQIIFRLCIVNGWRQIMQRMHPMREMPAHKHLHPRHNAPAVQRVIRPQSRVAMDRQASFKIECKDQSCTSFA